MKLFNAPSIGNEHISPHKLIPKTLITQLRTRSYLHEYDAQGRGKPSPYPIRSVIPSRIGYGLGLPLPWSRGSSNRQGEATSQALPPPWSRGSSNRQGESTTQALPPPWSCP